MRRSQHEAAIRQHLSALAWADDARAKAFVRRLAGLFGIFEATGEEIERATFLAEHARFHARRPLQRTETARTGPKGRQGYPTTTAAERPL